MFAEEESYRNASVFLFLLAKILQSNVLLSSISKYEIIVKTLTLFVYLSLLRLNKACEKRRPCQRRYWRLASNFLWSDKSPSISCIFTPTLVKSRFMISSPSVDVCLSKLCQSRLQTTVDMSQFQRCRAWTHCAIQSTPDFSEFLRDRRERAMNPVTSSERQ